jgi:hypothetical protein
MKPSDSVDIIIITAVHEELLKLLDNFKHGIKNKLM